MPWSRCVIFPSSIRNRGLPFSCYIHLMLKLYCFSLNLKSNFYLFISFVFPCKVLFVSFRLITKFAQDVDEDSYSLTTQLSDEERFKTAEDLMLRCKNCNHVAKFEGVSMVYPFRLSLNVFLTSAFLTTRHFGGQMIPGWDLVLYALILDVHKCILQTF